MYQVDSVSTHPKEKKKGIIPWKSKKEYNSANTAMVHCFISIYHDFQTTICHWIAFCCHILVKLCSINCHVSPSSESWVVLCRQMGTHYKVYRSFLKSCKCAWKQENVKENADCHMGLYIIKPSSDTLGSSPHPTAPLGTSLEVTSLGITWASYHHTS
jgi:hypothetical protein